MRTEEFILKAWYFAQKVYLFVSCDLHNENELYP
jgi:hypothetical protein